MGANNLEDFFRTRLPMNAQRGSAKQAAGEVLLENWGASW